MSKNSKNKLVNSIEVDWSFDDLFKDVDPSDYKNLDLNKYDQAYAQTADGKIIQCFLYLKEGIPTVIPEPEPSLMFFKNAENKLDSILKYREEIFSSMKLKNVYKASNLFSLFFNLSFDFIVNLFASIEAFNNSVIPEEYTFRHKRKLFNREKIQRYIGFEQKIEVIIPEIFEKSFLNHAEKYDLIKKMRLVRNNMVHTKNQSKNWQASYRSIYRNTLDFDYIGTLKAVKEYMNFYEEDWIQNTQEE